MSCHRILHVIFSSRIAGSERYCIDLANRQAAAGHEVHVAGMRSSPIGQALSGNVTFHPFNRFMRGFFLRRLVKHLSPDICHSHLSGACKALKGVSPQQQTVATLHVGYKAHQHGSLSGVICVNRAQTTRLDGYRGMARTIPNWMPLATAKNRTTGIRHELGLADDVFLIGAVGRLHPSKGMDVLISAFRESAPAHAALVILGEGPQRQELERLSAGDSRIHLVGYRPDVQECLQDINLFVSPSREESFGLAIVEAMGAGLPVIATAAEGPREFLLDQPVSLVQPDSVSELAVEISRAHDLYMEGHLNRISYDLSAFDPELGLNSIMDFYGQLIEAGQWSPVRKANSKVALAT